MTSKGFTLMETVVVVALSASMMVALGFLIYNFNSTSEYQKTLMQSSGSASAIMREMTSLVTPANAVLQTYAFSDMNRNSSSTVLVLEIPSIDGSGNVIANTYDYAAFYVSGTNAYRLLETNISSRRVSGTKKLSSAVNALTFSYNDADFTKITTVTIDVQTQATTKEEMLADHRQEQIRLRNH